MSFSLPADPPTARSLTAIVPQLLASLSDAGDWFVSARSAILVLVDGLGRGNLTARAGHARFLTAAMTKKDAARSTFPSTTATALTGLLTATDAGTHGIVGYRARIPGTDIAPNQLKGWETDGLDPMTWQRAQPLLEREANAGRPTFVVSKGLIRDSGFTRAIQRGPSSSAPRPPGRAPHRRRRTRVGEPGRARLRLHTGTRHPRSRARLGIRAMAAGAGGTRRGPSSVRSDALAGVGALVTADHGMVDVPAHRHVLLRDGDPLLHDVALVAGGEPRMLQLYTTDGSAAPSPRAGVKPSSRARG